MSTFTTSIRAGDTIENPVTGERITFLQTAADTDGELVEIEVTVEPDGAVAAAHVHPYQSERFEVLEGTLEFRRGRHKVTAGPGEVVTVAPGMRAQLPQRRRDRRPLPLRGAPGAPVRALPRDDVRPRRRRQDEQEGHAEPAAPRGDRQRPLRRRPPPVRPRVRAEGSARHGLRARPPRRLHARPSSRAASSSPSTSRSACAARQVEGGLGPPFGVGTADVGSPQRPGG